MAVKTAIKTIMTKVRWKKPEIGWVKLNVDGSRHSEGASPSAGCGGVLRDACGTWLLGFAKKLDPTLESHQTELQAILTGVELASKMNVEKVIVESDSESVVSMVERSLRRGFNHQRREHEVVESIRKLRVVPKWQVKLVYVPRNANRVAHKLANDACKLSSHKLTKYPSPPDNNCTLLFSDDNDYEQGV